MKLQLGQTWSRDQDTGLWLARTDHVTWILASDWSRPGHGPRCELWNNCCSNVGNMTRLNKNINWSSTKPASTFQQPLSMRVKDQLFLRNHRILWLKSWKSLLWGTSQTRSVRADIFDLCQIWMKHGPNRFTRLITRINHHTFSFFRLSNS